MYLMGWLKVEYQNKKNETVRGYRCYFSEAIFSDQMDCEGQKPVLHRGLNNNFVPDFFINEKYINEVFPYGLLVGRECDMRFDRYGNLAEVIYTD